jgi:hypothetical protein
MNSSPLVSNGGTARMNRCRTIFAQVLGAGTASGSTAQGMQEASDNEH